MFQFIQELLGPIDEARPLEVIPAVMIKQIKVLASEHGWEANITKGDADGGNTVTAVHAILSKGGDRIDVVFDGTKNTGSKATINRTGDRPASKQFDRRDFDTFLAALSTLLK